MDKQGMTVINPATIAQRAEALEVAEKTAKPDEKPKEKPVEPVVKEEPKVEPEVKPEVKPEPKVEVAKKAPNDPEELRKWNTKVSQENAKMRDELRAIKAEQEKVYKLLSSMSKKPIDYKELAKNPDAIQKLVEEEKENATAELQEKLNELATEAKAKDTALERIKREHDSENYPEWKRLFPTIVKLAQGPTGQGDPRVDYTRPASEVLDSLYQLALEESPAAPVVPIETVKTYSEAEFKSALADAVAKEKIAIAEAAKKEATVQAQRELSEEAKGTTLASAGKGAGRIPSDHLAAFKKMSLSEQRDWLIQQSQVQQ
jgi:hypothetical protein